MITPTSKITFICLFAALLLNLPSMRAAEKIVFREDFPEDKENAMQLWATNCKDYKIHYSGPSEEYASSGKKSWKLDVTLTGGHYFYYAINVQIPFNNPVTRQGASLKVRGKYFIKQADGLNVYKNRIEMGYGWGNPEIGSNGCVTIGKMTGRKSGWSSWEADASAMEGISDTACLDHLALFIKYDGTPFNKTRIILYIDDIEVAGDLPEDYRKNLADLIETKRQGLLKSIRKHSENVFEAIHSVPHASGLDAWKMDQFSQLRQYAERSLNEANAAVAGFNQAPLNYAKIKEAFKKLKYADYAIKSSKGIAASRDFYDGIPYLIYHIKATQNDRLLPSSFPLPGKVCQQMEIKACCGEYKAASFAIQTPVPLKGLSITATALHSKDSAEKIPASALDVRTVKVWWQDGIAYNESGNPTLAPELLLKDDEFVKVDYSDPKKHSNILKNPDAPVDAKTLQPVNIPGGEARQFWITLHAPPQAKPGEYSGSLDFSGKSLKTLRLPITVKIHPFNLEDSNKEYMAYYTGSLFPNSSHSLVAVESENVYRRQIQSLVEHGIKTATLYCQIMGPDENGKLDFSRLKKELTIRKDCGMTGGPIPFLGSSIPFWEDEPTDQTVKNKKVKLIENIVRQTNDFCDQNHFPRLAFYGVDEVTTRGMEWARKKIWALKAVRDAGGETCSAESTEYFEIAGDYLSYVLLALHGGSVGKELINKIHRKGFKALEYGRPQGCAEEPETFRRGYGVLIWKDRLDGAGHWAWQDARYRDFRAYDDFNKHSKGEFAARKFIMAYPTVDGVIDTVQYEGMREGINDMRYISTLLKTIQAAEKNPKTRSAAGEAETFLDGLDVFGGDLDEIRDQISAWIIKLNQNP
ncbi:MAG: hypothetical protein PHV34_12490 [Verrucomicrobiae bacterium]|nr:hypothetical protein [Verrucomicrobiae bacterium]